MPTKMVRGIAGQRVSAFNGAFDRAAQVGARVAELHPYIWKLAWEAVHRIPFLLPHDRSYRALRHFIAAKPDGLFLDIGANDGISALSFRKFSKTYHLLALEPNPVLEPALKKIKSTDPRFEYKMVGAGDAPRKMTFFVPTYKSIVLHTFTSGNREQLFNSVARSFGQRVAAATKVEAFEGTLIPADDLHVDPTIIKIDAEGFDYAVLQGLQQTIRRARPFVITEVAPDEYEKIRAYFDKLNYELLAYNLDTDRFYFRPASWYAAVKAMSGHRNFFAIPEEAIDFVPIEITGEIP